MKKAVESLLVLLIFDRRNRLLVRINPEQCAEPTYISKAGDRSESIIVDLLRTAK